jgi:hypothetical protein
VSERVRVRGLGRRRGEGGREGGREGERERRKEFVCACVDVSAWYVC